MKMIIRVEYINRALIPGDWRERPNLQDTQNATAANIDIKKRQCRGT